MKIKRCILPDGSRGYRVDGLDGGFNTREELMLEARKKGGLNIHFDKEDVGSFTEYAKRNGGWDEKNQRIKAGFAEKVAKDPKVSEKIRKKAQFAANARKWKH